MIDDLRAAAERCRQWNALGPNVSTRQRRAIYPGSLDLVQVNMARQRDLRALADAYLAEHPADDGEPVTEDWLRAVGFRDYVEPSEWSSSYLSLWTDRKEHNVAFLAVHWARPSNPEGHYWSAQDCTLYKPAHPKTRGDLRRLAVALGAPLTEESR